jgi:sugar lactone lactonase YvrE
MVTPAGLWKRLLAVGLTASALLFAPSVARATIYGHLAITNQTPTALTSTSSTLNSDLICWSDANQNCSRNPPNEIDPGATLDIYFESELGINPGYAGQVTYTANDPNVGFYGSGISVSFVDVITAPNRGSCASINFYRCTNFSVNSSGNLQESVTVTDTDTCPGSGSGPCAWSADTAWGSKGNGPSQFSNPSGVALDGHPLVYVADTGNDRVQVFSTDGKEITSFGSRGSGGAQFQGPLGVGADPRTPGSMGPASVYVADTGNARIDAFGSLGAYVSAFGPPILGQPQAAAVAPNGNIYVTDPADNLVQMFAPDGTSLGSFGGTGQAPGNLLGPLGIAVDASGAVYVADSGNKRVQIFDGSGKFIRQIGNDGSLTQPWGVAAVNLGPGFVAVSDSVGEQIHVYRKTDGAALAPWGAFGSDNGEFNQPRGIAAGADGSIYVADTGNNRIQKFSFNATRVAFVGRSGKVAAAARRPTLRRHARRGGVVLRLRCSRVDRGRRCHVLLTFHNSRALLARQAYDIRSRRTVTVRLPLSKAARKRLRARGVLVGKLLAHARQPGGRARITHARRLVVRR